MARGGSCCCEGCEDMAPCRCWSRYCARRSGGEPLLPRSQPQTPPCSPPGMQSPHLGPLRRRSDKEASKRYQEMMDEGKFVLNRGLGALRIRDSASERKRGPWCSPAARLVMTAVLITFPIAVYIEVAFAKLRGETLLKDDIRARSAGLSRLVAIPLTCAAINYLIAHIRQTCFWWEPQVRDRCCGCDPLSYWPMLLVTLGLFRSACLKSVDESAANHVAFYIEMFISLIGLGGYYALLDKINAIIRGMASEQVIINKAAPVQKMQNLVRNVTRSGRPEKDSVYCFEQTNTVPAEVLFYVWWLYYITGKVLGAAILLAMFVGMDSSIISHFMLGFVALSTATASGFMFELGPNTLSLIRLSLNKPFYVGDLVTLNSNGAMDAAGVSIMGFVENITMMYIVIRNFEMKQTWIPHKTFGALIIQNWTRRPTKTVLLNIGVSSRCPVKKVEQLTAFGKRWIQASNEIQQSNYQKCHITKIGNGYNIEVIFFPGIGVSHRGIRQKFLVAFMAAAERMQVPFVPLQIMQNFCDETSTAQPAEPLFEDAAFDDLLPDPTDKLPKGVGMGFRAFPEGASAPTFSRLPKSASELNLAEVGDAVANGPTLATLAEAFDSGGQPRFAREDFENFELGEAASSNV